MSEEKRRARRIQKSFILRAAVFGEQPLRWSHVTIHNLSSSGALFTFDRPIKVGTLLHFKIDFPERLVECMGRVRRLAGVHEGKFQEVGASFEGIRPDDRNYIDHFVQVTGTGMKENDRQIR